MWTVGQQCSTGGGTRMCEDDDRLCQISLLHSDFMTPISCSNGASRSITGRGLSVVNNCYTSQLTMIAESNTSISCERDDGSNCECISNYLVTLISGSIAIS